MNEALILNALGRQGDAWPRVVEVSAIATSLGALDVAINCAETACAVLTPSRAADAAVLLGSADSARERAHAPRFPVDLPLYDRLCAELNAALGEERFLALRTRGRVTPLRTAVAQLAHIELPAALDVRAR